MGSDREIRQKIGRGIECLSVQHPSREKRPDWPEEPGSIRNLQKSYLDFLSREHPAEKATLDAAKACLAGEKPHACLNKLIHGENSRVADHLLGGLSEDARYQCLRFNTSAKNTNGDSHEFILQSQVELSGILEGRYSKTMPVEEKELFVELAEFYYRSLPSWLPGTLSHLRATPSAEKQLKAYEPLPTATQLSNPELCANGSDYRRFDLSIRGLSRSLPFFAPKSDSIPWFYYRDLLTAQFETLKSRIIPADFEKLLSPEEGPSLSFLIGTEWKKRREFYAQCGIEGSDDSQKSGQYFDKPHRIALLNAPWWASKDRLAGGVPETAIVTNSADTLYHEIGHAIDRVFLDEKARQVIQALFRWMAEEYPVNPQIVPQPKHWINGRPYAMKNSGELFAQMTAEFFSTKASGIEPKDSALRARMRLMEQFFSPEGIRAEVWTAENIEASFRAERIDLTLTKSGFSLPFRVGLHRYSLPFENGTVTNWSPSVGIGFGYYTGKPLGFRYGGGIQADLSLLDQAKYTPTDGPTVPTQMRVGDAGAYANLSYVSPWVELGLEPGIGLRHFWMADDSENQLWLGGSALFGLTKYGASLGFDARFTPEGSSSLGGQFRFDVLRAIQAVE
jgi:hypothetical protein